MRAATLLLLMVAGAGAAETLPVKTYPRITSFAGDRTTVIAVDGPAQFTLISAHKEAGRPWADALFERRDNAGRMLVARAYDCAAATFRWMGEAERFRGLSLSITSMDQIRDRPLLPGTVEFRLARYVCAL
ncbi:MAG: hypothetical protein AAF281_04470 [Pseudomonadota bacterium]